MNKEIGVLLLLFAFCYSPCRAQDPVPDVKNYTVMTGGNSWLVGTGTGKIAEAGYIYNEHSQSFATYFYAGVVTGAVQIYLSLSNSVPVYIEMSVVTQYIQIGPVPASTDICEVAIGKFSLENDTYIKVFVQIFPATAGDKLNGVVQSLIFEGSMTNTVYIPAGVANFYAGRKSPGANLWLSIPTYEEITHFYSEITMPVGFDTDGAYFLTHGWSSG